VCLCVLHVITTGVAEGAKERLKTLWRLISKSKLSIIHISSAPQVEVKRVPGAEDPEGGSRDACANPAEFLSPVGVSAASAQGGVTSPQGEFCPGFNYF